MLRALPAFLVCVALSPAPARAAAGERIVFLGDSITDGNTYPLLVRQALAEAGRPAPVCINAGIGGDTAAGMRKRLDRDVFVHKAARVTLSAGINDVLHKVKPSDYEADVAAIAEQCKARGIPLVVLTTSVLGPKWADADKALAEYNAILHRVAERHGFRVAEVNALMQQARAQGTQLLDEDQVHPNFAGHRLIARAVLDALGDKDVPVPKEMDLQPLPGLVCDWDVRAVPKPDEHLDEAAVRVLRPDAGWKHLSLPEKGPIDGWWRDQERRRGFAMGLDKSIGPGRLYQAVAYLEADKPRQVAFYPAAEVQTVWLNGKKIYQSTPEWRGWHVGRDRVPARLEAGRNTIVTETGANFLLSVTDAGER